MIPVLLTFLGLVLVATCAEFLRQARQLDRVALIVLLLPGLWTRPDLGHHRAAVADSLDGAVLGLGLFGRVFVLDGLPDHRR